MLRRGFKLLTLLLISGFLADAVVDAMDECHWTEQDACEAACHAGNCQSHQGAVHEDATVTLLPRHERFVPAASLDVPSGPARRHFHPPESIA